MEEENRQVKCPRCSAVLMSGQMICYRCGLMGPTHVSQDSEAAEPARSEPERPGR